VFTQSSTYSQFPFFPFTSKGQYPHSKNGKAYPPFGSVMKNRTWEATSTVEYRFGFNGKEKDDEVNVDGGSYAFELRIYDSRLCRWLSTDPREGEYAWQSTYAYFSNCPITILDYLGGGDGEGNGDNPTTTPKTEKLKAATFTVQTGDTPESIAKKFGINVWDIANWNRGNQEGGGHFNATGDGNYKRYWAEGQGREWQINEGDKLVIQDPSEINKINSETEKAEARANTAMQKLSLAAVIEDAQKSRIENQPKWTEQDIAKMNEAYQTAKSAQQMATIGAAFEATGFVFQAGKWVIRYSATKGVSQILSWGKNAKGHLIAHADELGFGSYSPQQLQKMLPQLRSAANQLYNNLNLALTRIGRWGGQTDDVLMHITNNGKMLVTKQNGEFITIINKTSNNWYQLARPLK